MTREEAINYLEMSMAIGEDDDSRHHNEVLEFIIKALEQEPCVTMRDLSGEELKHFAEEMKKVRPQVVEQEPRWIPVSERLPEGATNGDMIKAMFPNIEIEGIGGITGLECVAVSIGLGTSYFALDWWDAPYKAESEGK